MKIIDLFSGAGGMSLGFEMAGFELVAALDNWEEALRTLSHNNPKSTVINIDLSDKALLLEAVSGLGEIDGVIGGPPCQGFSIAGKRDPDDPRNRLYRGFVQVVSLIHPKFFVMENVPNLASTSNRELFEAIRNDFIELGYVTSHKVLIASDYGVPQNRKRLFLVGIRSEIVNSFQFPIPTSEKITAFEAISDLPMGSLLPGEKYPTPAQSNFQKWARTNSTRVWNHEVTTHTEKTVDIIGRVPDGGNYKDLPKEYLGIRNVNIAWTRLSSTKPSFTIDTGHRHHFHYEFNRVPTVRESARLQSFPDDYIFLGSKTSQARQVGNAVPPLLAYELAKAISQTIGGY